LVRDPALGNAKLRFGDFERVLLAGELRGFDGVGKSAFGLPGGVEVVSDFEGSFRMLALELLSHGLVKRDTLRFLDQFQKRFSQFVMNEKELSLVRMPKNVAFLRAQEALACFGRCLFGECRQQNNVELFAEYGGNLE